LQEKCTIIGKILKAVDRRKFNKIVDKYKGDYYSKNLSCWEQFVAILLGQITNSNSLRDIETLIKYHSNQQYHLGIRKNIARSTLAKANEKRSWKIYMDLFNFLVKKLNIQEQTSSKKFINLIDSTPIKLDLLKHPWAEKTQRIKGLKVHVMYNLTEETPTYFTMTGAKTNDIVEGKKMSITLGSTYVFDKGYTDYNWWKEIDEAGAFFVTRLKKKANVKELSEVQETNELISSQIVSLASKKVNQHKSINNYYGKPLKKVMVSREKEGKEPLILITNDLKRSDEEIAELYKKRWQIELFFKWIKQNLKIKKFLGRSENAIKTQICIAMISYVLMKLVEELKGVLFEVTNNISDRIFMKLIGNELFRTINLRMYGRKRWKNPNQLQFVLDF
jgi:putative transposase